MTEFQSKQSEFEELNEAIRGVLDEVSDICWISSPPSGAIESHFGEVRSQLSQLNEKVGTYENEHRADCDSIKEYLQTIRSFISGQSGKGQVIISTYTAGTIQRNPLHQRLDELHGSSSEYIGTNYEELQAVSDRMQAEIDAEIAKAVEERKTQGIIGIVNGVIMAGGSIVGVGAIILSGGAATPVVAGLLSVGASTTILYGASDIYEGGDTYRLADAGDLTSIARNPIRDSVFNGNQMVYDTWGTIGSLAFLAGGMMQTAAISSQGTVQVENLTERANAVGKGAGGADDTYANKGIASGDDWNNYLKDKYGSSNVRWDTAVNSMDDILDTPSVITRLKPEQLADFAQNSGWKVEPLGKGSKAGLTYEQGGGFSMRAPNRASEYIQYHPGGGHHGELPYYKISSGKNGTVRYFIAE